MADKKATLILELKDLASKGVSNFGAALSKLRSVIFGVTAAIGATVAVLAKALDAYGEQELAVKKLNQSLKNQGIESEAVTRDLIKYAEQLQKTTTMSDDVALGAMSLAASFGIVGEDLKKTTALAADLAAGLDIDLKTSMLLLGKAFVGDTSTLSRYGIKIAETIPVAQRFGEVQKQIAERFGGAAQAQADTYSGKIIQMKNAFSDLMEEVGAYVVGPATSFLNWLKEAIEKTAQFIGIERASIGPLAARIDQQKKLAKELEDTITRHEGLAGQETGYTERLKVSLRATQAQIAALEKQNEAMLEQERIKATAGARGGGGMGMPDADLAKLQADADARIQAVRFTEEQLAEIKIKAMADELALKGDHVRSLELLEAHQTANAVKQNQLRARNMVSTLQFISGMASSNNKTLAAMGKAAGVTMATIDTYAAANKALASAPPPFNFALAALVTAAGMANVAQISGVKLAEGGMIMPSAGGTSAIMAEAGKPEVAIPLDDERTGEKLRETLGGGNTIVIQAGAIVADEYSINQFAQKIDEKLYDLQRNRRSYL